MVAAGMKKKKKDFVHNEIENLYLNYGVLGLATQLYNDGYQNVKMFQGDFKKISDVLEEIEKAGIVIEELETPVFISIPSFFAVEWAKEFIYEIKRINTNIKVIVGGRWVVDTNAEWIRKKMPYIDCISHKAFGLLNYAQLNNFQKYQPTIEISRGCGNKCEFCLEKDYPVSKLDVIVEAKEVCDIYKYKKLNFYFQASIFNPTIQWAEEFAKYYTEYDMEFKWRFETRVDTINLEAIKILSKVGLKVIDLGLESASIEQIVKMNKSKNPEQYLKKAEALLKVLHEYQVWPKLNILLYLGETLQTIEESKGWLDKNKEYIKGVSVNPFILYLNGNNQKEFFDFIEQETGSPVNRKELEKNGFLYINLSKEIPIEKAKQLSKEISDRYMSLEDYLQLKSICYSENKID